MRLGWSAIMSVSVVAVVIAGCDSKFVESSPNSVKVQGLTLQERLDLKHDVDSRIEQIQSGAEKIKSIIDMFKRIQNPRSNADVYTPIDFFIDLNEELKNRIPENDRGRLVRRGKVHLPLNFLSEECKDLDTLLKTESIYDSLDTNKAIGEKLVYSFRTCNAEKDQYTPVLEVNLVGRSTKFSFNNENLEKIFKDLLIKNVQEQSSCQINQEDNGIISSINCSSISLKLSQSEDAYIDYLKFNSAGEIRLESKAEITENSNLKALSSIKVFANGKVEFNLEKIK